MEAMSLLVKYDHCKLVFSDCLSFDVNVCQFHVFFIQANAAEWYAEGLVMLPLFLTPWERAARVFRFLHSPDMCVHSICEIRALRLQPSPEYSSLLNKLLIYCRHSHSEIPLDNLARGRTPA